MFASVSRGRGLYSRLLRAADARCKHFLAVERVAEIEGPLRISFAFRSPAQSNAWSGQNWTAVGRTLPECEMKARPKAILFDLGGTLLREARLEREGPYRGCWISPDALARNRSSRGLLNFTRRFVCRFGQAGPSFRSEVS